MFQNLTDNFNLVSLTLFLVKVKMELSVTTFND